GLRKMVIANSHGGNTDVVGIVARDLRVRLGMLVVTIHWHRFGLPSGLYSPFDVSHGIHAGDIETSLMLHFRPDLVDMTKAKLFPSKAAEMESRDGERLQASAPGGPARLRLDCAGHQSRRSRGRRLRGDRGERPSDRGASGRRLHRLAARCGALSVER